MKSYALHNENMNEVLCKVHFHWVRTWYSQSQEEAIDFIFCSENSHLFLLQSFCFLYNIIDVPVFRLEFHLIFLKRGFVCVFYLCILQMQLFNIFQTSLSVTRSRDAGNCRTKVNTNLCFYSTTVKKYYIWTFILT